MTPPLLVLTAHGSADTRSIRTVHAVAAAVGIARPSLPVQVAFCERSEPLLDDVLGALPRDRRAVVVPLLLAAGYHARHDIPAMIAASGADVELAGVLGEDDRLVHVLRQRLEQAGVSRLDARVGVLVTAVGSSHRDANSRTATLPGELTLTTRWTATEAFATGPRPTLGEAAATLRSRGATRLVVAPWFLAPGRITDRVAGFAAAHHIPMSAPLGAHRLVAATVLDRYDTALAHRLAA